MASFELKGNGFEVDKLLKEFQRQKSSLPRILGNIAENHFKEGFRKGGGQTNKTRKWKKRKRNDKVGGRAILVKSGRLRRDVRARETNFRRIRIATSSVTEDYATVHNKGTSIMPQREFIGKSNALNKKILKRIRKEIKLRHGR